MKPLAQYVRKVPVLWWSECPGRRVGGIWLGTVHVDYQDGTVRRWWYPDGGCSFEAARDFALGRGWKVQKTFAPWP